MEYKAVMSMTRENIYSKIIDASAEYEIKYNMKPTMLLIDAFSIAQLIEESIDKMLCVNLEYELKNLTLTVSGLKVIPVETTTELIVVQSGDVVDMKRNSLKSQFERIIKIQKSIFNPF